MRTIYGPIDSWRFGRSLGIDPLATRAKICPFSCTYCQYGPTLQPTLRRQTFVPATQLRTDLDALGPIDCDQITFAGLGEPTLARNLADLAQVVRQYTSKRLTILTGSALLPRADVRRDLVHFEHVVVKLDAPNESLFRQINHPMPGFPYSWATLVKDIRLLRQAFAGQLSLQMMFLQANLDFAPQMAALARFLEADAIYLDTPLQPALGGPVTAKQMAHIEQAFVELPDHTKVSSIYLNGQAQTQPRFF